MFDYELDRPLPGEDPDRVTESTVKDEMAGFGALFSAVGSGSGAAG